VPIAAQRNAENVCPEGTGYELKAEVAPVERSMAAGTVFLTATHRWIQFETCHCIQGIS
jgi:hypothetical protein